MSLPVLIELHAALASATASRRASILDQVADLFLAHAGLHSPEQIAIFDEVLLLLIKGAGNGALVILSNKLASLKNAPANTLAALARHDNVAIAGPVLEQSPVLSESVMVEIANGHPKYLPALAGRARIGEKVADILIDCGDAAVLRKLAANAGAHLSEIGFVKLINRAKTDSVLANAIAARADMPPELAPFLDLALKETAS